MSPTLITIVALVAVPAAAFAAIRWRRAVVMSLPFLAILNGLAIPIGDSSIRADQLAACILLAPLAASLLIGARKLKIDSTAWLLAAILALNVIASELHSPARSYSLLQCVNLATVWLIYLLLINFLETREDTELFLTRCIQSAMIAAAIGIVAYLLAIAGFKVGGAEVSAASVEHLTRAYGAYGTMVEPNLFGSFTAAYLVLAIALLTLAPRLVSSPSSITISSPLNITPHKLLTPLAALSAAGLVLSFTRAAWLGALAGILFFAFLASRALKLKIRLPKLLVPLTVGAAVVVVLALTTGGGTSLLRFKLLNLFNFTSQTAVLRLATYALAFGQVAAHPIIGWGTFTFAPIIAEGADFQRLEGWRNLWIGNYLLLALHDSGVIGLLMWLGMLWSIIAGGVRAAVSARISDPAGAARTVALTAAVATLLIPYLATTGFSLGFTWILIGLLGAYRHQAEAARAP